LVVRFCSIPELSFGKVQFLSVKLGKDELSEFEKFDNKEFTEQHHLTERQIVYKTIEQIAYRGARPFFFRQEGPAHALPGKVDSSIMDSNPDDFGIRLYCILLREDLVLLLNGDVKTKHDPTQCPLVNRHFKNAKALARVLFKASADGFIRLSEKGIEIDDDFQIEI
jgi:hypothetical protein